jgi:hypothetical protein
MSTSCNAPFCAGQGIHCVLRGGAQLFVRTDDPCEMRFGYDRYPHRDRVQRPRLPGARHSRSAGHGTRPDFPIGRKR